MALPFPFSFPDSDAQVHLCSPSYPVEGTGRIDFPNHPPCFLNIHFLSSFQFQISSWTFDNVPNNVILLFSLFHSFYVFFFNVLCDNFAYFLITVVSTGTTMLKMYSLLIGFEFCIILWNCFQTIRQNQNILLTISYFKDSNWAKKISLTLRVNF